MHPPLTLERENQRLRCYSCGMTTSTSARLSLALVVLCALAGCEREPGVAQSSQPKDTSAAKVAQTSGNPSMPAGHSAVQPGTTMPAMDQAAVQSDVAWLAPAGWREDKTPRPMREATFQVGEGDKAAEVVVTRLGGQFGDMPSNINRWRGQVDLGPLADATTVTARDVKSPAGDVKVYSMEGPTKAITVGMLKQGDFTWFFKLVGDKGTVTQNTSTFDQFLQSLRIVSAGDK